MKKSSLRFKISKYYLVLGFLLVLSAFYLTTIFNKVTPTSDNIIIPVRDRLYTLECTNNTYNVHPSDWAFNTDDKCNLLVKQLFDYHNNPTLIKRVTIRSSENQPISDDNFFTLRGTTEHFAVIERSIYKSNDRQKYWNILSVNLRTGKEHLIKEDLIDNPSRHSVAFIDYANEKIIIKKTINHKGIKSAGDQLANNSWNEELIEYDLNLEKSSEVLIAGSSFTDFVVYAHGENDYLIGKFHVNRMTVDKEGLFTCNTISVPCNLVPHPLSDSIITDITLDPIFSADKSTVVWVTNKSGKYLLQYANLGDNKSDFIDISQYVKGGLHNFYVSPRGSVIIGNLSGPTRSQWYAWTINKEIARSEFEYDMNTSDFLNSTQPVKLNPNFSGSFAWISHNYDNRATFLYSDDLIRLSDSFEMNSQTATAITSAPRQFIFDSGDPDIGFFKPDELK